jgi:hypothetical protein
MANYMLHCRVLLRGVVSSLYSVQGGSYEFIDVQGGSHEFIDVHLMVMLLPHLSYIYYLFTHPILCIINL